MVLLTPDDVGHPAGHEGHPRSRARQNVILELGYFLALLGRDRVCALKKEDVEYGGVFELMDRLGVDRAG